MPGRLPSQCFDWSVFKDDCHIVYSIRCYTALNNIVLGECEPIGAICDYVDDVCLENYEFRTCDRPDWTGTLFIYKIFIYKRTMRTC